jgi:Flp pilus assembly protein TadG
MLGQLIRNRSGAAAAEMALVAPLLLAVMFGAMELGYYFYSEHVVVKAVRDGARFASRASFASYDCSSPTNNINATVKTQIQEITRTNQITAGGTARLPGWTDDTSVSVDMVPTATGTYGSIYAGLPCIPVVTVTATVPYTSLFSLLGFNTSGLQLQATSQTTVMGA